MDINFSGKRTAVVGIGISNLPLIYFLLEHGASVSAYDKKTFDELGKTATDLEEKGVSLVCGEHYLDHFDEDIIFRSPGIRFDNPGFADAVARGAVLTSEMELFFELTPARIIGVTGSDGKTTTTTLIYKMLSEAGYKTYVGGNIGKPLLPEVEKMTVDDIAVVELSSFQLQTMKRSPDISVITNLSPNHLDYHKSMGEYSDAKKNIFLHEKCRRLVLNYKNDVTRAMADDARKDCEVVFFMRDGDIYEDGDMICCRGEEILDSRKIVIPGHHNIENYMAAIGAVREFCSNDVIRKVATTFGGVEHRCELVREKDGVKYFNSSIDSSPTRTTAALSAFRQKVIVICGGYDKHIPFEPLAKPLCDHAKCVILTGATAPKIKAALDSFEGEKPDIYECPDFTDAIMKAHSVSRPGDMVLLSPACASFDAFKNFAERGCRFKEIVNSL